MQNAKRQRLITADFDVPNCETPTLSVFERYFNCDVWLIILSYVSDFEFVPLYHYHRNYLSRGTAILFQNRPKIFIDSKGWIYVDCRSSPTSGSVERIPPPDIVPNERTKVFLQHLATQLPVDLAKHQISYFPGQCDVAWSCVVESNFECLKWLHRIKYLSSDRIDVLETVISVGSRDMIDLPLLTWLCTVIPRLHEIPHVCDQYSAPENFHCLKWFVEEMHLTLTACYSLFRNTVIETVFAYERRKNKTGTGAHIPLDTEPLDFILKHNVPLDTDAWDHIVALKCPPLSVWAQDNAKLFMSMSLRLDLGAT